MVLLFIILFSFPFTWLNAEENDAFVEAFLAENNLEKLELNKVSDELIYSFPLFSEIQATKILKYREKKEFHAIEDLFRCGVTAEDYPYLLPYLGFKPTIKTEYAYFVRYRNIEAKLSKKSIIAEQFFGYKLNHFTGCFLTQKDKDEMNYLDHRSYFLEYQSDTILQHLILGKYRVRFGQGLLLANPLAMGKSEQILKSAPASTRLSAYSSFAEVGEMRGLAGRASYNDFYLTSFISSSNQEARKKNNELIGFDFSGNHNKKYELTTEKLFGIAAEIHKSAFDFSYIFMNSSYPSKSFAAHSIATNLNIFQQRIFGEYAMQENKYGFILGMKRNVYPIKHIISLRLYENGFRPYRANPISEFSNISSEMGLYHGIMFVPKKRFLVGYYFDFFKRTKLTFTDWVSKGYENLILLSYKKKGLEMKLTYKKQNKTEHLFVDDVDYTTVVRQNKYSITTKLPIQKNSAIKLKGIVLQEKDQLRKQRKNGKLFYLQYEFKNDIWQHILRVTTSHSQVPIYVYENDIWGVFSNKIFTDDNVSTFWVCRRVFKNDFSIQIRSGLNLTHIKKINSAVFIGKHF